MTTAERKAIKAQAAQDEADSAAYVKAMTAFVLDERVGAHDTGDVHDLAPQFVEQHRAEPWLLRMAQAALGGHVRSDLYEVLADRKPRNISGDMLEVREALKAARK